MGTFTSFKAIPEAIVSEDIQQYEDNMHINLAVKFQT